MSLLAHIALIFTLGGKLFKYSQVVFGKVVKAVDENLRGDIGTLEHISISHCFARNILPHLLKNLAKLRRGKRLVKQRIKTSFLLHFVAKSSPPFVADKTYLST